MRIVVNERVVSQEQHIYISYIPLTVHLNTFLIARIIFISRLKNYIILQLQILDNNIFCVCTYFSLLNVKITKRVYLDK